MLIIRGNNFTLKRSRYGINDIDLVSDLLTNLGATYIYVVNNYDNSVTFQLDYEEETLNNTTQSIK